MNPINIGVIGCGRIADLHLPGYQGLDRAGIYAVCDVRKETAERRREQWGAEKAYTDYRDLIRDPAVDAVEILTPHQLHEAMAIEALRAGKHVALQKPMTTSLASADRILEAASRAGVVFKVTDNYLFYPPIVLARKMIGNGD
ncbi:MAG: Gfo/Idh/MocA family oxidoreductase, partial [Proteobacteria bacterium]|nr:Gfo/Idh/MocA family oxidoreductase [Pseudomonadota bacterium]